MSDLYYVCRLSNDGSKWEGLRSTHDKDYSEILWNYFCDLYRGAYIEILTHAEYHSGIVNPI